MPTAAAARALFAATAVTTASNTHLLLMTYDRLVLDLERAETAQRARDLGVANRNLQHAQKLLVELARALDVGAWSGAPSLKAVYSWLVAELVRANTTGDPERTAGCLRLVEPLREAWQQAAAVAGASRPVPAPLA